MSITFARIKDPRIGLTDKLTFGKYTGCRVCDILEDDYEYVLWLESRMKVFSPVVIEECENLKRHSSFAIEEDNNKAIINRNPWGLSDNDWDDDIPF